MSIFASRVPRGKLPPKSESGAREAEWYRELSWAWGASTRSRLALGFKSLPDFPLPTTPQQCYNHPMPIPRIIADHPGLTAAAVYIGYREYTEHKYPGRRALRRRQHRGMLIVLVFGTLALAWSILCVTTYALLWLAHKAVRADTSNLKITIPGLYPQPVPAATLTPPTPAELRAIENKTHTDGLARHEEARQLRILAAQEYASTQSV